MEQKIKRIKRIRLTVPLEYREKIDKLKQVFNQKTDMKLIMHMVDLEIKRQGI